RGTHSKGPSVPGPSQNASGTNAPDSGTSDALPDPPSRSDFPIPPFLSPGNGASTAVDGAVSAASTSEARQSGAGTRPSYSGHTQSPRSSHRCRAWSTAQATASASSVSADTRNTPSTATCSTSSGTSVTMPGVPDTVVTNRTRRGRTGPLRRADSVSDTVSDSRPCASRRTITARTGARRTSEATNVDGKCLSAWRNDRGHSL